jgi:CRISPR-associated protein Csd1
LASWNDFTIVKPLGEPEYYSIWRILVNIATQDDSENIPPNLAGDFMRSILNGTPYPTTLLHAAINRIRSDTEYRVKPVRAALIKAYLNRYNRFYPNKNQKEVSIELDVSQPSVGYQLGRLFAVLEKIQEEANPGINTTIRERFYGAACATPVTVFANLLRLKNHHLAKLENKGRVIAFEQLLSEIMGHLQVFPSHLDLHEQGRFAIGYYHQRQDFFKAKGKGIIESFD